MSPAILILMTVPISLLAAVGAMVIEYRSSKMLRKSALTVILKSSIGILIAVFLQMLGLFLWISLNLGLTEAKVMAATITEMSIRTFLFLSRWDMLRLLPVGVIVTLATSGDPSPRYRKILQAVIASVISIGIVQFLFAKQIYFSLRPSAPFLAAVSVLEGLILAIILERLRIPKATLPRQLLQFLNLVRANLAKSTIIVGCGLLIVLYLIPRDSRIFLKLSKWGKIAIEYSEIPLVQKSKFTSLLFTLFDAWPIAGGETVRWVSFKSPKKTLYFNFLAHKDDTTLESKIELKVSRIDNYPPINDLLLFRDLFRTLPFQPQLVFRENISPGTFLIEAPEFACVVYTPHGRSETNNEYGISAPFLTTITLSKENSPAELFAPGIKEISLGRDWISIDISDKTLGFNFTVTTELMMFCMPSSGSLNQDVHSIQISGEKLAEPVKITTRKALSKNKPDMFYPAFLIELRRPNSRVTLGILDGARHIGVGTSDLSFIGGNVRRVGIEKPTGTMKIDVDQARQLDAMDEIKFSGQELQISPGPAGEITIQGRSRDITLNGVPLAKPLLPEGLTKLIGQVVDVVK